MGKLLIWFLFFTLYFNLVHNLSILSIKSLTFEYQVNLVITIISWMKISDMTNDQNKKLAYCHTIFIQNIIEVIKLT